MRRAAATAASSVTRTTSRARLRSRVLTIASSLVLVLSGASGLLDPDDARRFEAAFQSLDPRKRAAHLCLASLVGDDDNRDSFARGSSALNHRFDGRSEEHTSELQS